MSVNAKNTIEVCFSPIAYSAYKKLDSIVVVIDVLRATSAICTAFQYGAEKMIPVATVEEAQEYKKKGFLAGAERDAIQLEGFDFGNSPFGYMTEKIKGKTIALTTTNGTQAIEVSRDAYKVVIGAFVNITTLCNWLKKQNRDIILLCSGWKNRFNLEDSVFAGAVAEILSADENAFSLGDSALASSYLYKIAKDDPDKFLMHSSHKERLARLGLKEDIKYCLSHDKTNVLPVLNGIFLERMVL